MTAWPPAASVEMGWLFATPLASSGTGPPRLAPSMENCTVPCGVLGPLAAVTAAVKLTDRPYTDGSCELVSMVNVSTTGGAGSTDWSTADEALPTKLASPPYVAVTKVSPSGRLASWMEAVAPLAL